MNKDVAELWATALESGKYVQGRERLTTVDTLQNVSYCCLGVLCELARDAGVEMVRTVERTADKDMCVTYDDSSSFPPPAVLDWAGLDSANPLLPAKDIDRFAGNPLNQDGYVPASLINDEGGRDFKDIAGRVREMFL